MFKELVFSVMYARVPLFEFINNDMSEGLFDFRAMIKT
jgi:hypothetical protein